MATSALSNKYFTDINAWPGPVWKNGVFDRKTLFTNNGASISTGETAASQVRVIRFSRRHLQITTAGTTKIYRIDSYLTWASSTAAKIKSSRPWVPGDR